MVLAQLLKEGIVFYMLSDMFLLPNCLPEMM